VNYPLFLAVATSSRRWSRQRRVCPMPTRQAALRFSPRERFALGGLPDIWQVFALPGIRRKGEEKRGSGKGKGQGELKLGTSDHLTRRVASLSFTVRRRPVDAGRCCCRERLISTSLELRWQEPDDRRC